MRGHSADPLFNPTHQTDQPSEIWDKFVCQEFVSEAPLNVGDEGNAKQQTRHLANNDSLMEMSMDDVGTVFATRHENLPQQQDIDINLVP
jgi:hypothetical protein